MENTIINIKDKVKEYLLSETFADKSKLADETLIFKEGFFDSMGFVMILTFIEENFDVKAGDSDLVEENFESINAITEFISKKTE